MVSKSYVGFLRGSFSSLVTRVVVKVWELGIHMDCGISEWEGLGCVF